MADSAQRLLMNEFKTLSKETWTNIELINENVFEWSVALIVLNPDSLYYRGYFKARMTFPKNYPYSPPDFKFLRPLYHPNIYPDGRLCISILHPPGEDELSGETAAERWSPVQRVETVLISVLSLLDDPEVSSPANVDAGVMLRNNPSQYNDMVRKDLEISKQDVPSGFLLPTHETAWKKREEEEAWELGWEDSDVESFGGSESDLEGMDDDEDMDSDFGDAGDDDDEDEDMEDEHDGKEKTKK